jgi:protein-tyrosine phosphatase
MFDMEDVSDPYYGAGDGFERVLDQIEGACARWLQELKSSPK